MGLIEFEHTLVSETSSTPMIIARLRSLRFFSLSSVPHACPSRDDLDILFDTHLVSCETVLVRRICLGGALIESCAVEEEELELELLDALSLRR